MNDDGEWRAEEDLQAKHLKIADVFLFEHAAAGIGDEDILTKENATLDKADRKAICTSIRSRLGTEAEAQEYFVDVSEVFSPPRLTAAAPRHKLVAGSAFDLTNGWDFNRKRDQMEATSIIDREKPRVLMLCPKCSARSALQNLSRFRRDPKIVEQELAESRKHFNFCVDLALRQYNAGRGFMFEQPRNATSWQDPYIRFLASLPGVQFVDVDMCMHGMRVEGTRNNEDGSLGNWLNKKPTGILTNIPEIAEAIRKKCDGSHPHGILVGGTARKAQVYPSGFVDAILQGLKRALATQGILRTPRICFEASRDYTAELEAVGLRLGEDMASEVRQWLEAEAQADADLEQHELLCEHFPTETLQCLMPRRLWATRPRRGQG